MKNRYNEEIKFSADSTNGSLVCRFIEVAHGVNNRNHFIPLDNLAAWLLQQPDDAELYTSLFQYCVGDPLIGPVSADFLVDFDCAENPEKARREAVVTAKYLISEFEIEEPSIAIAFSGGKGFHISVSYKSLGVAPHFWLPRIFRSMAEELAETLGLKTVDLKIYDRRRLIRLVNSKHAKSGLYKIPLTLAELEKLSISEIRALAAKPRLITPKVEPSFSGKAHAWFTRHKEEIERQLAEKKPEFKVEELENLEILPCVKKRLETGAKEGERNTCAWQLASYLARRKVSLDDALRIMRDWWTRVDQGLHAFTWEECEKAIRKTYEVNGYLIGCGSEFVEGLCVGKEVCPLFQKKGAGMSPEQRERAERLLKDPKILDFVVKLGRKRLIGEDETLLTNFIIICSGQSKYPISGVLTGFSGSGKNESIRAIKPLIPPEWVFEFTTSTPEAVKYIPQSLRAPC